MVIYIGVSDDGRVEGWSSTPAINTTKIEIEDGHPFFNDNPFNYYLRDGEVKKDISIQLEGVKFDKDRELSDRCEAEITSGFPLEIFGSTYYFSYDKEAQTNVLDTMRLFENNMIDEINWNGRLRSVDGERVRMTLKKEQFYKLYMASVKHKFSCISKYRDDLTQLLHNSKTIEEVESITWESIEESTFEANLKDDQTIENKLNQMKNALRQADMDNQSLTMAMFDLVEMIMMGY